MITTAMILWTAWDLFLAALPVGMAWGLVPMIEANLARPSRGRTAMIGMLAISWFAFLPNSCYLLTEWRHFLFNPYFQEARNLDNPAQFSVYRVARHAGFYLAFSGFGMLCFVISTRTAVRGLKLLGGRPIRYAIPFYFLVALGVYLGLVVRFNSWDLLVRPFEVLRIAAGTLSRPFLLCLVAGFAGLLASCYLLFDIWMDGLAVRLQTLDLKGSSPRSLRSGN